MQLNKFSSLKQGGWSIPKYEAELMELLIYEPYLNMNNLRYQ